VQAGRKKYEKQSALFEKNALKCFKSLKNMRLSQQSDEIGRWQKKSRRLAQREAKNQPPTHGRLFGATGSKMKTNNQGAPRTPEMLFSAATANTTPSSDALGFSVDALKPFSESGCRRFADPVQNHHTYAYARQGGINKMASAVDTEHPANRVKSKSIMIVGAGSAIAQAACETLAEGGKNLFLVVRRSQDTQSFLRDLRARAPAGSRIEMFQTDYLGLDSPEAAFDEAEDLMGPIDGLLVAFGYMPDESLCRQDPSIAREVVDANFGAPVRWLNAGAARMQSAIESGEIEGGFLAAISSVAGFRPRASLSLYASSKAGLSGFMEAMAGRLADSGIRVIDIRPGPTASKMTAHLAGKRRLADPRQLAPSLVNALGGKGPWAAVYLPGTWRWITLALKFVPFAIFRRLPI